MYEHPHELRSFQKQVDLIWLNFEKKNKRLHLFCTLLMVRNASQITTIYTPAV